MFEIYQERYRQIALECLAKQGITPAAIAMAASPGLKRFRLDVDLGRLDVEPPEVAQGEDPLLPYATSLLTHLIAWPPKVEAYGINIAGMIEAAICWIVGLNETEKPDWDTRVGRDTSLADTNRITSSRLNASRYMEQLLHSLPLEHYSNQICEVALFMVADSLQHIPVGARTPEVCLKAVEVLTINAAHIPPSLLGDESFLLKVFEMAPFTVTMISDCYYTPKLIETAVAGREEVIVFIADELLSPKLLELKFRLKEEAMERGREKRLARQNNIET